jgi:hypothetical protein
MVKQADGQTSRWSNKQMVKQADGQTSRWSNKQMVKQADGQTSRWSNIGRRKDETDTAHLKDSIISPHHKTHYL